MSRLLLLPVLVVMLSVTSASPVLAQANLHQDFASSSREPYSESKRLYKEGVKYALAGLFAQAAEIFEQAVKLDPQFADAHFALGHAYFDMGQWQRAIDSFQRAIELNPKDAEAQDRLGFARQMLAREPGNGTSKTESAAPSEPARKPVAEQVSLSAKSSAPPASPADNSTSTPDSSTSTSTNATGGWTTEPNAAATEFALTKLYRVGPGDVLDVRVNDSQSPQSTLFTVTAAGLLEHPILAEPMHVGGMSVDEIGAAMEADLKRRALLESPKVSVGVRDYASHAILVSGLVKDSGTKILRREAIPLYVVVADAQPLPEAARVTVVRSESNQTYEADLNQPVEMNILVRPGDVITLSASVTQFLYIGGEVKSPGEKTYRRGLTLTQAIISAGGVTNKAKEARLGRDDGHGFLTVTRFKLKEIESGKIADPPVRPGDRIMIVEK
ncbi:MAG TPA: tetratricopeptide repeat protein [Pyrinomonadaceae bacterium]|jgi:protein involved in polysaccharide export with SLBB domain